MKHNKIVGYVPYGIIMYVNNNIVWLNAKIIILIAMLTVKYKNNFGSLIILLVGKLLNKCVNMKCVKRLSADTSFSDAIFFVEKLYAPLFSLKNCPFNSLNWTY